MCFISKIVRLGYEYMQAVAQELEAAIEEPSWFHAYREARLAHRLVTQHVEGIEQALSRRLTDHGEPPPPEFTRWLTGNRRLVDTSTALVATVHDREQKASAGQVKQLQSLLGQSAYETVDIVLRIEALTGDISEDVGQVLARIGATG